MKQEQIKDFTRRISQANRSGLVVIVYDIIFACLDEAEECLNAGNYEGFKQEIRRAGAGIDRLIRTLDFQYDVSKELYPLYVFAKESMAKAVIKKSLEETGAAKAVLMNLYAAFLEIANQDQSKPLMQNTQQVYAGITYGKNDLTEIFQVPETSRGFLA